MTGNFFHLVLTNQLCSLTSVQKPLYPSLHPISYISVYVKLHVYMCGSIAKTHSQSLEKDFSSEEFSLQGEPGLSFSKLSAHLGADFLFLSSLSTSDRGPWPLPGPCYWNFQLGSSKVNTQFIKGFAHLVETIFKIIQKFFHVSARVLVHSLEILEEADDSFIFFGTPWSWHCPPLSMSSGTQHMVQS